MTIMGMRNQQKSTKGKERKQNENQKIPLALSFSHALIIKG
ncbi:hypothetical protein HPHPP41_0389 [Helicobacter pylori Hp P-41]|nr:hypothetical protein HPHPP41_0389 [Helicobacter pylori Hp P-41]